jgi:TonB family protein
VEVRALFEAPEPPRRSPWSTLISFVLHATAFAAIAALAYFNISVVGVRPHKSLQFVAIAIAPPVEVPVTPIATPPPVVKPEVAPEPPKAEEPPPPVVETPKVEPPPAPEPPKPVVKKPDVVVGAFDKAATAQAAPPPRQVVSTAFDTQQAVAANLNLKLAPTGAFDQSNRDPRLGSDVARGTVASTGFDQRAAAAQTGPRGVVTSSGFGTTQAAAPQQAKPQVVQQAGFAPAAPPAPAAPSAPKPFGPTTQVEITFKPMPEYTDEARAQRVEGEVILTVNFTADGAVRVERVVKGLGHGLDEKAIDAATRIRFKPALDQGRPVDSRADVRILFKLT